MIFFVGLDLITSVIIIAVLLIMFAVFPTLTLIIIGLVVTFLVLGYRERNRLLENAEEEEE